MNDFCRKEKYDLDKFIQAQHILLNSNKKIEDSSSNMKNIILEFIRKSLHKIFLVKRHFIKSVF